MSGWRRWGVQHKLFSVMLLVLVLNVVILLFAGSAMFERFYTSSKVSELQSSAQEIRNAYQENSEDFFSQLSLIENRNILVSVLTIAETGEIETLYHSRMGKNEGSPREAQPDKWGRKRTFESEEAQVLKDRLVQAGEGDHVEVAGTDQNGKDMFPADDISLVAKLNDELFLLIQTPRGYIKSTADLAVKYTALLSIAILSVGALAIYFLAGRLTKPICRMQQVADRIAALDFSDKCTVSGNDEISKLGACINNMSTELESSIIKLVAANEVLQNDLQRQQQTDRMRREFVANVSHDFKTPLTLMMSYAEAIKETTPPEQQEQCDIIINEGARLSVMVGRLLELSKLENGIEPVEYSIFCLDEVLDNVLRAQKILSDQKQITVVREAEDAFIVHADFHKIGRVMNNLFENAVKYTEAQGTIRVCSCQIGERCRVSVENTGSPIKEQQMGSLFDSFYRADSSRTSGQSYGLGLAVVKRIMEALDQEYGVENTETGVRFWVDIALAEL